MCALPSDYASNDARSTEMPGPIVDEIVIFRR
jgi:hypothetical protein